MVGWHHQLNGHEFGQGPGVGDGQGGLAYCSRWGCKESDTTERLNNNNKAQKDQKEKKYLLGKKKTHTTGVGSFMFFKKIKKRVELALQHGG